MKKKLIKIIEVKTKTYSTPHTIKKRKAGKTPSCESTGLNLSHLPCKELISSLN